MLIYLASPYTIKKPLTGKELEKAKHERFKQVCEAAGYLMDEGFEVFCPIAHSHPIEIYGLDSVRDADFWLKQDFAILKHCDKMIIDDTIEGWDQSEGIYLEAEFCFENNIPVELLSDGQTA